MVAISALGNDVVISCMLWVLNLKGTTLVQGSCSEHNIWQCSYEDVFYSFHCFFHGFVMEFTQSVGMTMASSSDWQSR